MKISNMAIVVISAVIFFLLVTNTIAQQEQLISNEGEITVAAKSGNVWKVLTNTKKYAKVMGYKWKSGKKKVDSVGDQALVEFLEQETAYQVKFIEPGHKLTIRIAPSNAAYVNEKTWVVTPVSKWKTKVSVTDVYTLPSDIVPPTVNLQINKLQETLERLRDLAERS